MEIDLEKDRKDLVPLWEFRRLAKKRRQQVWFWWRFGLLVDRTDRSKGRVRLPTVLDGSERCTTWAAYKWFCEQLDVARRTKP